MKRGRGQAFPKETKQFKKGYTGGAFKAPRRVAPVPGYTRTVGAYRRSVPGVDEKKYLDVGPVTAASIATNGTVIDSFNKIPQGTTDITRVGNKVNITNWNMRIAISLDDAGTGQIINGNVRCIFYVDKQCNGATAAATDILTSAASITSFRNMDQVDRFIILKEKWIHLTVASANALHTMEGSSRWYNFSKKLNLPVHFSSTTGAITEIRSNNLGVLFISDLASINLTYKSRVKFVDA